MNIPSPLQLTVASLGVLARVHPRLAGPVAFRLFCATPPRARIRPDEREVHDAARTSTIDVDGTEVVVYRWGTGDRPVLLVHGRDGRASNFAALVTLLLEAGRSVVAFDAPGHGESGGSAQTVDRLADTVVAVAEATGGVRGVVGHSFGGLAVMNALRRGLRVEQVATVAAVCRFDTLPRTFVRQTGLPHRMEHELRRRSERLLAHEQDIWQRLSASYSADQLDADVLVLHDEQDREVDVAEAHVLAGALGDRGRLALTSGLGHRRILRDRPAMGIVADHLAGAS